MNLNGIKKLGRLCLPSQLYFFMDNLISQKTGSGKNMAERALSQAYTQFNFVVKAPMAVNQLR